MNLGLFANLRKPGIPEIVPPFLEWLKKRGIRVLVPEELRRFLGLAAGQAVAVPVHLFAEQCDAAMAMGGDGTMLTLAQHIGASGKPIVGVNLGGLGFLAEVSIEDLYAKMEKVIAGEYTIQKRMVLEASAPESGGMDPLFALNDVVVYRGAQPARPENQGARGQRVFQHLLCRRDHRVHAHGFHGVFPGRLGPHPGAFRGIHHPQPDLSAYADGQADSDSLDLVVRFEVGQVNRIRGFTQRGRSSEQ